MITHNENASARVVFCPQIKDNRKVIGLTVPRPDQKDVQWSEDKLSASGNSSLTFRSETKDITLKFGFTMSFSENKDLYGGSSMLVSSVSLNSKKIERLDDLYVKPFIINIEELF